MGVKRTIVVFGATVVGVASAEAPRAAVVEAPRAAPLLRHLQTGLPVDPPGTNPPCLLCPAGEEFTNPDGDVILDATALGEGVLTFPCEPFEEAALSGQIPSSFCLLLPAFVDVTDCVCGIPTPAPVTAAPVTPAPVAPVTPAPVTPAPVAPTTPAPVTGAPVTGAPVTPAPVAPVAPVSPAPVTSAPVSPAPVTSAPVSPAPVTAAPVTAAPVAPVTSAPVAPQGKKGKKTKEPTPAPAPVVPTTPLPTPAPSKKPTKVPTTPVPTPAPVTPRPTPAPSKKPTKVPTAEPTPTLEQVVENANPFVELVINLTCLAFGICPVDPGTLYPPGTSPP